MAFEISLKNEEVVRLASQFKHIMETEHAEECKDVLPYILNRVCENYACEVLKKNQNVSIEIVN